MLIYLSVKYCGNSRRPILENDPCNTSQEIANVIKELMQKSDYDLEIVSIFQK
jgi:hypothetical protein